MLLQDKIAVVTGASRGIGRATAKALAREGAMVIVNYNGSKERADEVVSEIEKDNLLEKELNGVCVSTETEELGIYKSFNYEIFERRSSVVLAFDGNSPVSNLVQEAKNGKGKAKIYINEEIPVLREKARSLGGYVIPFNMKQDIVNKILEDNPDIGNSI